ncbi:MAG: holo-ACP synthase [Pseudomonadota bacterium]
MIIGVGNDMVDIRRIEKTLERFGDRFTHRIYTELERQKAARRPNAAPTLAKRFAAKEACSKALGTGFRRGVFWRDMGVINLPTGQPTLKLSGGALLQLQSLIPENHSAQINLTLTDDFPWAQAIVIISANPTNNDATG